jgi:hypothetical protein
MTRPTINAAITMTDEQLAALTAADIEWLADGITYFDPYVAGVAVTPRYHEVIEQIKARRIVKAATKQATKPTITMKRADCGHMTAFPMTTANGSSCEDCYDRMSN